MPRISYLWPWTCETAERIEARNLFPPQLYCAQPPRQRRWRNAAGMFHYAHKNQAINILYSDLKHQNKPIRLLECLQSVTTEGGAIRILYCSAGRPTAPIIKDQYAVLESAPFQTVCRSRAKAYYLIAIIDSNDLLRQAKSLGSINWAKEMGMATNRAGSSPYFVTTPATCSSSALADLAKMQSGNAMPRSPNATTAMARRRRATASSPPPATTYLTTE